ncbi:MAG: lysophospholipid acyltransferase family protein, partial [Saprospiraceae bacterium]|nr:lysophospholipid acyltransferase family protein [Saprospiraceae bacterium]
YGISDLLSWSLFHVIRYRRRLVFDQLRKCFPDWPDRKIYEVARLSYTNLSDILLESFKTVRLTEEEIKKRYKVMNSNILKSVEADKGTIIGIGSHMNNWEWGSVALEYQLPTKLYALYKPLANKYIDTHVRTEREAAGGRMVSVRKTRHLFNSQSIDEKALVIFIADQSPSNMREAIWLEFLGRDTACLHGPEKYHKIAGAPVVYFHIYRVKRGFYEIYITPLKSNTDQGITEQFMKLLEEDIRKEPASWLWTHNRWKRRREEAEEQRQKLKARRMR